MILILALSPTFTKTHSNFLSLFGTTFFSLGSSTVKSLTAAVSDFTTTELIGTANTFAFVFVRISTVAVIPGLNGE
ncbi:hypothetical protein D3C84_534510 [compost metagenome]